MLEVGNMTSDIANKAFYGFKLDLNTSKLTVEVIFNGNGVVRLPEDDKISPDDYKQWIWSDNTLEFQFNNNGHLEMSVL
jgi:hypothetical protein